VAIGLAFSMGLLAAEPAAVERARARLANLQELFKAGAVSARQVEQAELAVKQALDDEKIDEAVYGELAVEELTEEQAAAMTAAAQRRLVREQEKLAEAAKLVSAGVAPRSALLPYEDNIERARRTLASAEERAKTVNELIAQIRVEEAEAGQPEEGPIQGPASPAA
jgi:outer membrane protein TolC